uniref:hypothetical protein n=1 Tax=Candidatus Phytoplasma sp. AldY-WA1 TaxID=2852100 RepID=UPI00254F9A0C
MKQPTPEIEGFLKKPSTKIFISIISTLIVSFAFIYQNYIFLNIKQVEYKVDKVDTSLNDFIKE